MEDCEHTWQTFCDGDEHTDVCVHCGLTQTSPCTEVGEWPDPDSEDEE